MPSVLKEKIESLIDLEIKNLPDEFLNEIARNIINSQQELTKENISHLILDILCSIFRKPWGDLVDYINSHENLIDFANNFVLKLFSENNNHALLAELLVCLLENNNILFHKKADYTLYQKLAEAVHKLIDNKSVSVDKVIRARYYSDSVYADYMFLNDESKKSFEIELQKNLLFLETEDSLINERFLAYINISQFYLFQGTHEVTLSYLNKAKNIEEKICIPNYRALFWYHYSWIYVEKGDYKTAKENINSFFSIISESKVSSAIYLHCLNINASIEFRLGNIQAAFDCANKCYERGVKFYQTEAKDVIAENLVTMARCYKINKDYDLAEQTIKKAIADLEIIFGSQSLDPSQAAAHIILGDIFMETSKYAEAKAEYSFSEEFYKKFYKENFYKMYEVSIVLANLAILHYRSGDRKLAEIYLKKLTDHFAIDNENVLRAQNILKNS
ncbi:Tetratricopeptide repeat protein [Rickettsiales bacterium Ac37b]|nr:Tetratricopeptide repeat protein [Rickettsiales bacterium Ac37b]